MANLYVKISNVLLVEKVVFLFVFNVQLNNFSIFVEWKDEQMYHLIKQLYIQGHMVEDKYITVIFLNKKKIFLN